MNNSAILGVDKKFILFINGDTLNSLINMDLYNQIRSKDFDIPYIREVCKQEFMTRLKLPVDLLTDTNFDIIKVEDEIDVIQKYPGKTFLDNLTQFMNTNKDYVILMPTTYNGKLVYNGKELIDVYNDYFEKHDATNYIRYTIGKDYVKINSGDISKFL